MFSILLGILPGSVIAGSNGNCMYIFGEQITFSKVAASLNNPTSNPRVTTFPQPHQQLLCLPFITAIPNEYLLVSRPAFP